MRASPLPGYQRFTIALTALAQATFWLTITSLVWSPQLSGLPTRDLSDENSALNISIFTQLAIMLLSYLLKCCRHKPRYPTNQQLQYRLICIASTHDLGRASFLIASGCLMSSLIANQETITSLSPQSQNLFLGWSVVGHAMQTFEQQTGSLISSHHAPTQKRREITLNVFSVIAALLSSIGIIIILANGDAPLSQQQNPYYTPCVDGEPDCNPPTADQLRYTGLAICTGLAGAMHVLRGIMQFNTMCRSPRHDLTGLRVPLAQYFDPEALTSATIPTAQALLPAIVANTTQQQPAAPNTTEQAPAQPAHSPIRATV